MHATAIGLAAHLFAIPVVALGAVCAETTYKDRAKGPLNESCTSPYTHPDAHKEGILRLLGMRDAIVEEIIWADTNGGFGVRNSSRLPHSQCRQFLQDVISLNNVEVVTEGSVTLGTFSVGAAGTPTPRTFDRFREWRLAEGREIDGYVVVRWRKSTEFVLRGTRKCGSSRRNECTSLIFQHLDAHDRSRPIACSFMTVGAQYWRNWKGEVTPIEVEIPVAGPRSREGLQKALNGEPGANARPKPNRQDCPYGICLRDYR